MTASGPMGGRGGHADARRARPARDAKPQRIEVDGIYIVERMAQAAAPHDIEVQVSTRDRDVKGFKPLPLRWRIGGTFGTLTNRHHRLTRNPD